MRHKQQRSKLTCVGFLTIWLCFVAGISAEGGYPADYKPSKPAEKGETNVLVRLLAVSNYMTDKLNAAGGDKSPMCYRNCLTISFNEILKCTEAKGSYGASESCEKDAANRMSTCDPKCQ
jgi:hypothetical protein